VRCGSAGRLRSPIPCRQRFRRDFCPAAGAPRRRSAFVFKALAAFCRPTSCRTQRIGSETGPREQLPDSGAQSTAKEEPARAVLERERSRSEMAVSDGRPACAHHAILHERLKRLIETGQAR